MNFPGGKEVLKFKIKKMPFIYTEKQAEFESPVKVESPFKRNSTFNMSKKGSGFGRSTFQTPRKSINEEKSVGKRQVESEIGNYGLPYNFTGNEYKRTGSSMINKSPIKQQKVQQQFSD